MNRLSLIFIEPSTITCCFTYKSRLKETSPPTSKLLLKEASPPSVNVLSITVAPITSNVPAISVLPDVAVTWNLSV